MALCLKGPARQHICKAAYVPKPLADKFKDDESVLMAREFWEQAAPKIDNARRFSEAAENLNQALRQSVKTPRWWRYDNEEKTAVYAHR